MAPKNRRAYVLVLPSLFTTGNLFCGFFSILRAFNHDFERAAYAIIFAGIFDVLDGRVARITGSQSNFGMEYDSIADVVSFGIAPAILSYVWALQGFGRVGYAAAFFFAACGALRLARFNTLAHDTPKSYFIGLPIPAAANLVAAAVILNLDMRFEYIEITMLFVMFALGMLMVSSIRYRSFKDFDLRHKRSFFQLAMLVMLLAVAVIRQEVALCLIFGYYVCWGPVRELASLIKRTSEKKKGQTGLGLAYEHGGGAGFEKGPGGEG